MEVAVVFPAWPLNDFRLPVPSAHRLNSWGNARYVINPFKNVMAINGIKTTSNLDERVSRAVRRVCPQGVGYPIHTLWIEPEPCPFFLMPFIMSNEPGQCLHAKVVFLVHVILDDVGKRLFKRDRSGEFEPLSGLF